MPIAHSSRRLPLALLALSFALPAGSLRGQGVGPPVPPGHWSYELLEILDAAGASAAWMTRVQGVPASVVRRELERVGRHGFAGDAPVAAWLRRLDREIPGADPSRDAWRPAVTVEAGVESGRAHLDPGEGAHAGLSASTAVAGLLAAWGSVHAGEPGGRSGVRRLGVGVALGPFALQVGRQAIRAAGPGLVSVQLNAHRPLDAVLLTSTRPLLPPVLGWLTGPTYWQLAIAPWQRAGELRDGWVAVLSGAVRPHPALELGFARVVRCAGEGAPGITPERLARMLIMVQNRPMNWDDQKLELALRARWRLLGRPMAGYVVIAQEDAPIWTDAGVILGIQLPLVGRRGAYGLRYEYTAYGPRARWCFFCEDARGRGEHRVQGEWFVHTRQGAYLRDGLPAGDPLGGYGAGHTVRLAFFPAALPVHGATWASFQVREEGNLLFERWPGKRRVAGIELSWEAAPGVRIGGTALASHGPAFGWEHAASIAVRATLGGSP